jgi:hypothetical protein
MEDENDLMSAFDSGMELNFDNFTNYDDQDQNDDNLNDEDKDKNKLVDEKDDSQESVDKENKDNDSDGDDSGNDTSPNLYSSLADVLIEQGITPSLESSENVKSVDDLANSLKNEVELQSQRKLQEYLDNLDLEKIASSKKSQIELDSIDEDYLRNNLEKAKDIIYQDLLNQGLSEDRAKKMLKKTIDLGEDVIVEDALDSKDSLKEFEKRKEESEKLRYQEVIKQQKEEQQQVDDKIKKYIFESKEVVKGIPNTKVLQEKVFKSMTEIVAKNPQTGEFENKLMKDRSINPIEFDTKMYYFYELTNGFTDLSKIQTNLTSSATKKLETVLRKTKFEDNGTPGYMQDKNSYGGSFGSELVY